MQRFVLLTCVWLSVPMFNAQIFTEQSAEPLKINRSLSDRDRDLAVDRTNTDKIARENEERENGGEGGGVEGVKKEKPPCRQKD